MPQNLQYLENPTLLPYTFIKSLDTLDQKTTYPIGYFLLPQTAAVLLRNRVLSITELETVETEHVGLRRRTGVITNQRSIETRKFMKASAQFVDFYDGVSCFAIIDQRIIDEILRLSTD